MKGRTRHSLKSSSGANSTSADSKAAESNEKDESPQAASPTEETERGSPPGRDRHESISSHASASGLSHSSPPLTPSTPPSTSRRGSSHVVPRENATNYIQEGASTRSYTALTPLNPEAGGDSVHGSISDESANGGETSYVTYVEGSDHSSIFVAAAAAASANGQTMSYPVYTVSEGAAMFGSGTTQYYSTSNALTYAQESGVTYLVPSSTNSNSNSTTNLDHDSSPNITHATRVSPATVQWLMDNYETAEGVSLPRSTLYYHYLRHCEQHKLDPVNAASFGKLIRSVFVGLRTRRLGTRGNSKYHYYGIRLKPTSLLNHFEEPGEQQQQHHISNGHSNTNTTSLSLINGTRHSGPQSAAPTSNHMAKKAKISKSDSEVVHNGISTNDAMTIQQYLGDPSNALEDFPELEYDVQMPEGLTADDFLIFRSVYREHCELLLEDIVNFQLADVDKRWKSFWKVGDSQSDDNIIPRSKMQLLCNTKEVQHFVRDSDYLFYQSIVNILLPDVLRPIPSTMTQAIRNFAKGLEGNLSSAMVGLPDDMITIKVTIVNSLAQTLRRYTSLNHLAQAARAVLQNQTQISQMLSDLNRVDFHNVEEQAAWVCGCDGDIVPDLEADFKATLAQQQSLEQWAQWLEGVVHRILRPHLDSANFLKVARNFLLKWSFYSSLIIRDLTLRSAASFGSFHLLRLLYDEYMFFLVEQKVAEVSGTVPIAVIGKRSLENNLPSAARTNSLDAPDLHTQALVDRYIKDRELHQASELHSHHPSNGINGGSGSEESSGESNPPPEVHQPTHQAVKTEYKRKKNFLVV